MLSLNTPLELVEDDVVGIPRGGERNQIWLERNQITTGLDLLHGL